jgi:hypothetical protein
MPKIGRLFSLLYSLWIGWQAFFFDQPVTVRNGVLQEGLSVTRVAVRADPDETTLIISDDEHTSRVQHDYVFSDIELLIEDKPGDDGVRVLHLVPRHSEYLRVYGQLGILFVQSLVEHHELDHETKVRRHDASFGPNHLERVLVGHLFSVDEVRQAYRRRARDSLYAVDKDSAALAPHVFDEIDALVKYRLDALRYRSSTSGFASLR